MTIFYDSFICPLSDEDGKEVMTEVFTICLRLPYCITEPQASSYHIKHGRVLNIRSPPYKDSEQASTE